MHELSIAQSIIDACAERAGGQRVLCVTLEIGCLAGIAVDALEFCYPLCADGTPLQDSRLEIVSMPAWAHCRVCGTELQPTQFLAACTCGSVELDYRGGDELRIRSMEVI